MCSIEKAVRICRLPRLRPLTVRILEGRCDVWGQGSLEKEKLQARYIRLKPANMRSRHLGTQLSVACSSRVDYYITLLMPFPIVYSSSSIVSMGSPQVAPREVGHDIESANGIKGQCNNPHEVLIPSFECRICLVCCA
jgi:hypothetical protein